MQFFDSAITFECSDLHKMRSDMRLLLNSYFAEQSIEMTVNKTDDYADNDF
jgi:hypothetical protein